MHGLDLYDYEARHYDAAIGRFTTVDPMAEKYYSISPYAYCGNNPVNRIDPNGQEFTDSLQKYVDAFMNEIKIKELCAQGFIYLFGSWGVNNEAVERLKNELAEYSQTLTEIDRLKKSDQVYDLQIGISRVLAEKFYKDTGLDLCGYPFYRKTGKTAVVMALKEAPSTGRFDVFAHELKHLYQFETGYLSFDREKGLGGILYDSTDEIEAFRRGAVFGGPSQIPTGYDYLKDDKQDKSGTWLGLKDLREINGNIYRNPRLNRPTSKAYPLIKAGLR